MTDSHCIDLSIGGLRKRALSARDDLRSQPVRINAFANLTFVGVMALVQIAQELNETKHIIAAVVDKGKFR